MWRIVIKILTVIEKISILNRKGEINYEKTIQ